MNETDRTSIGLLYHENIIDYLKSIIKRTKKNNKCLYKFIKKRNIF